MAEKGTRQQRVERILCETDRHVIVGDVSLPPDGYQSRFSDAINRPEIAFLPIADAEIRPLDGGPVQRHDFVVIGKAHIRMAHPAPSEPA
jgi:hypothetical protein